MAPPMFIGCMIYLLYIGPCYGSNVEPDTGPSFHLQPPSNLLMYSHIGAIISCSAQGKPEPEVYWERANGSALPKSTNYMKIHSNDSLQFLPFSGPLLSSIHRAAYRCVARNSVGKVASRSVHVKTVKVEDYTDYNVYTQDVWVIEGNTAVFTCDIKPSFVKPYVNVIQWLINDIRVTNGENAIIMDSSLQLTRVNNRDNEKEIKCVTVNRMQPNLRKTSRKATLRVVKSKVETPPTIDYKKESIISKAGLSVTLPCVAQAYPIPRYNWSKNGAAIKVDGRISYLRGSLQISDVRADDSGMYWCNASNVNGYIIASTNLLVTESLSVKVLPRSQRIDATLPALLRCNISGGPYNQVSWYKDGVPIQPNSNIRRVNDTAIKILSVSRRDVGMYQCLVSSSNDNDQGSSQLALGVSAPVFHDTLGTEYKHPDESVSLLCKVYGNPVPTVLWKIAGEPFIVDDNTDNVKVGQYMTAEGDIISHVNISSLRVSDGGRYTCTANNTIGEAVEVALLNIYGNPLVRPMNNRTAVANRTLVMRCHVSGYPLDKIIWSRGSNPLRMDHRIIVTADGVLTINSVIKSDEGYYTCSANNSKGHSSSETVYVSVIIQPVLQPFYFHSLTQGDSYTVVCQIMGGDLPIDLLWYKNEELLSQYTTTSEKSPQMSPLSLTDIQLTYIANYTCVAKNRAGVVSFSAQLSTVNVRPYWKVKPNDSSVILKSNILLPCQGGGIPDPSTVWKKAVDYSAGQYIAIGKGDNSNYEVFSNGSLLVKNASLEDKGYYMCQVNNGVGPEKSQIILLTVNVPAMYLVRRATVEYLVGQEVKLECDALGDQPLSTGWSKSNPGQDYTSIAWEGNPRMSVSNENTDKGMLSVLTIYAAARQDSGDYWCTSKNTFDIATRVIKLSVRESPHPVEGCTVKRKGSRSITLSWLLRDDGNSPITRYIVQYTLPEVPWNSSMSSINSTRTTAAVSGLQPNTLYKFRVIAVNTVGQSDPSGQVEARTAEEAPAGPPRDVQVLTLSTTSIKVSWLAPQKKLQHGSLLGYKIDYKYADSSAKAQTLDMQEPDDASYILINLDIDTNYSITVAAYNSIGQGPYSQPVNGYTFEDVPSSAPANVTASVNHLTLTVKWNKPKLPYLFGQLSGYKVVIHSVNDRQDERDRQVNTTSNTSITFEKLSVYTNYSIQVMGYTEFGDGVRSLPIYKRTSPAAPASPCSVSASPVNSSAVFVSWRPPCVSTGVVREYELSVYTGETLVKSLPIISPNLKEYALVTELNEEQLYGFTVRAKNYQTSYGMSSTEVTASATANVRPTFAKMDSEVNVGFHNSLTLHCIAVGDPNPDISWSKRSSAVLPDHFTVFKNGTLFAEHVLREDADTYICKANNMHGENSRVDLVNVLVSPSPPVLEVNKTLASSLQVNWLGTDNGGFSFNRWRLEWRNGTRWSFAAIGSMKRSYWLRHLSCGQTYNIRMRSSNQEGSSVYSNVTSVQTLGGKPQPPVGDTGVRTVDNTSISLNLSAWSSNGCPISHFSIAYKILSLDISTLLPPVSSVQQVVYLEDLEPGNYSIEVTAYSSAGASTATFQVSTNGFIGEPWHQVEADRPSNVAVLVSVIGAVVMLLVTVSGVMYFKYRKQRLSYKNGNKSRHSMFSDTSDLDNDHPVRTQFIMPRENMSGDSRIWLLRNQPTGGVCEPEPAVADKVDVAHDNKAGLSTNPSVSPYAMFIYASARSGEYETCTPTLTYARAKFNQENADRCMHNTLRQLCHYCGDYSSEQKQLLDVEDLSSFSNQFNKLQLKQYEVSFDVCDEEFPPPPPEVLHEYHCEPVGKRCTSHEFMTYTGNSVAARPNTTGLRLTRTDTPGRMSKYPSAMSSMATVSSNQDELLMAYHNSKVNPPQPILFESPRRVSTSTSAQSSIATEPGIRMFTQSPPHPEESRQAVCEVPIYSTTLPSSCSIDSSDTAPTTDHEPRTKHSLLRSPHKRLYKRKNKKTRSKLKSRDISDGMSTTSDDNIAYGIPNRQSALSSASDNGYGTKTKDTNDSRRTSSQRARECGDLYEEEETLLLVQAAVGAGETTPPSSLRNLTKTSEIDEHGAEDTKLIDRYYRTVSADNSGCKPVELYTEDYTIV